MKKRLLATILALSLLAIPKVSFSEEAQSNLNLDKTTTKQEKVPSDINNDLVLSKVVSVELNNEKDPKSYLVKCLGVVSNKTNSVLKNVKVKVQIVDINRNVLDEVSVDTIDKIEPSQEKSFKVEKFINTETNKFNIRAVAKLIHLKVLT